MPVREFVRSDIPQVMELYWNYMGPRAGPPPTGLEASFNDLYFLNPLSDRPNPSFVYQDRSGDIVGFLGVATRQMSVCGRHIHTAFGGNFVVHPKARSGLAAARLLEAYMFGNNELLLTDSANDISRHLLERLGFQLIPIMNLHWARPLRPSHYVIHVLSRGMKPAKSAVIHSSLKPFCAMVDGLAGNRWNPILAPKALLRGTELTSKVLLQCLCEFRKGCSLWTEYNLDSLSWLLKFMERNRGRGQLRKIVLRDETQKVVGWYIYYVKRGSVGEVVQIGAAKEFARDTIGHLLNDAREQGVIALHGTADCRTMADLSEQGCFFTCRGGWTLAYSCEPQLIAELRRGNTFFSRLDGEWCLSPGE